MRCNSTGLSGTPHLNPCSNQRRKTFTLVCVCVCAWAPGDHGMFLPPRTRPRGTPPGCHTPCTWKGPAACVACGFGPPSTSGRCGRAPGNWPSPSPSPPDLSRRKKREGSVSNGLVLNHAHCFCAPGDWVNNHNNNKKPAAVIMMRMCSTRSIPQENPQTAAQGREHCIKHLKKYT